MDFLRKAYWSYQWKKSHSNDIWPFLSSSNTGEWPLQKSHLIHWTCFITQSPVSLLCFIMELLRFLLVTRNLLLSWKMPLLTDPEHNSKRGSSCKYQGGAYSRCSPRSWWLENKFHLMWFDFLSCSYYYPHPFTQDIVELSLGHVGLL